MLLRAYSDVTGILLRFCSHSTVIILEFYWAEESTRCTSLAPSWTGEANNQGSRGRAIGRLDGSETLLGLRELTPLDFVKAVFD